jgi:hypothetical protein
MKFDELEKQNGKRLTLRQKAFLESEDAATVKMQLKLMVSDPVYNTRASYHSSILAGTSFVDKHMLYLSLHPAISIQHYLSNLRLKSKIRM